MNPILLARKILEASKKNRFDCDTDFEMALGYAMAIVEGLANLPQKNRR